MTPHIQLYTRDKLPTFNGELPKRPAIWEHGTFPQLEGQISLMGDKGQRYPHLARGSESNIGIIRKRFNHEQIVFRLVGVSYRNAEDEYLQMDTSQVCLMDAAALEPPLGNALEEEEKVRVHYSQDLRFGRTHLYFVAGLERLAEDGDVLSRHRVPEARWTGEDPDSWGGRREL